MLTIGLLTEALIFLVYAILPSPPPTIREQCAGPFETEKGNPGLKSMEKMLKEADITPANLSKLSEGFQS
jgi:hypothetical protein